MKTLNKIFHSLAALAMVAGVAGGFTACSDDDLGPTIFDTTERPLDATSATFQLDSFVEANYREPYNVQFQYKYNDIGSNMSYNLVPVTYQNAVKFAVLGKYLWYDVYKQVVGDEFLKTYTPHIIMLLGSPAYNPSSGTEVLGTAEGGLKITLYKGNELDETSIDSLNEYFFRTMHHEFSHILHQNVIIPTSFREISNGQYNALNWQDTPDSVALSRGIVLQYATSGYQEDWVELIANYITRTDEQWQQFLNTAGYGWEADTVDARTYDRQLGVSTNGMNMQQYRHTMRQVVSAGRVNVDTIGWRTLKGDITNVNGEIQSYVIVRKQVQRNANGTVALDENGHIQYLDSDGIDGRAVINQKFNIIKDWLQQHFKYDIEAVHREVQRRQYVTNPDGSVYYNENGDPINALLQPSETDPSKTVMQTLLEQVTSLKK